MPIRGLLFDLFGTLVEYDAGRVTQNYDQTYQWVRSLGADVEYDQFLSLTDQVFAELDRWSEQHEKEFSMLRFADELFARLGLKGDPNQLKQFADSYTKDWSAPVVPVFGVHSFLSRCNKQFVTGVVTNTHYEPMINEVLERSGLAGFESVTTSVGHGRPKPHKEIFEHALDTLGLKPDECVFVGDNYRADYLGASQAGMQCYLVGQHARVPREYQLPSVIDLALHLLK